MEKISSSKILFLLFSVCMVFALLHFDRSVNPTQSIDNSFEEAVVVFGVAKSLNALISVIQGTEIGPPGITIAIGQALDPLNDLVERFSWVMLVSLASLGIQKILLQLVGSTVLSYITLGLLVVVNVLLWRSKKNHFFQKSLIKMVFIVLFVKLSMPLLSLSSEYVNRSFVSSHYDIKENTQMLQSSNQKMQALSEQQQISTQEGGFFESLSKSITQAFDYDAKIEKYTQIAQDASSKILNLIIAFVFNTLFFPLLFLFIFYKMLQSLLKWEL